jgi:hypothetical protein
MRLATGYPAHWVPFDPVLTAKNAEHVLARMKERNIVTSDHADFRAWSATNPRLAA